MLAYLRKSFLPSSKPSQNRSARPLLENLEDRVLLYSTYGGDWAYGSRITYSFAPDGTSIGGTPSVLFQTLNAKFAAGELAVAISEGGRSSMASRGQYQSRRRSPTTEVQRAATVISRTTHGSATSGSS